MKISKVRISNFRCLEDVEVAVAGYTALVGANGSGKSSVLYALDWFFNDRKLSSDDLTCDDNGLSKGPLKVEVEFEQLNNLDKETLGIFGRSSPVKIRKSWSDGQHAEITGATTQGPGFGEVRSHNSAGDFSRAYKTLPEALELPKYRNRPGAEKALDEWESDSRNAASLETESWVDASGLFRGTGPKLAKCFQMILVPAAADLTAEAKGSNKKSILSSLIGKATENAAKSAVTTWENENPEVANGLRSAIQTAVTQASEKAQTSINRNLSKLVEGGSVSFEPELPDSLFNMKPTVSTTVTVGEKGFGLERRGHGTQRAVLISVLQSVAEEGATGDSGSGLLVAFEEPEIYQHPSRARHFAKVLTELSESSLSQVVVATHSPFFIRPEQFESLRRFDSDGGLTKISKASAVDFGDEAEKVMKFMQREVEGKFAESFFADLVVLVEGDTDKVVLEGIADKLSHSFEAKGISLVPVGSKTALKMPHDLMKSLGIPVYVIADGDKDRAQAKHADNEEKRKKASNSNRDATQKIVEWLPTDVIVRMPAGSDSERYEKVGDPTCVTSRWTMFADDLEAELASWPKFEEKLGELGVGLRKKQAVKYRQAVRACDSEIPEVLKNLVSSIMELRAVGRSLDLEESNGETEIEIDLTKQLSSLD